MGRGPEAEKLIFVLDLNVCTYMDIMQYVPSIQKVSTVAVLNIENYGIERCFVYLYSMYTFIFQNFVLQNIIIVCRFSKKLIIFKTNMAPSIKEHKFPCNDILDECVRSSAVWDHSKVLLCNISCAQRKKTKSAGIRLQCYHFTHFP